MLAKSAGVFHWTPENRRLYDYSSGVLVANLGHNPKRWLGRLAGYMGWSAEMLKPSNGFDDYYPAVPLTAYNAVTEIETRDGAVGQEPAGLAGRQPIADSHMGRVRQ